MNRFFVSRSRGQASLEFILVLIFMLVIVGAVIVPLGQRAQNALDDVSKAGFVEAGLNRLDSIQNNMSTIPGSSRQIPEIYIPKGSSFICDNVSRSVRYTFSLSRSVFDATGAPPSSCIENPPTGEAMLCTKSISFPLFVELRCQGDDLPSSSFTLDAGQRGFTQRFRISSRYFPGSVAPSPLYIVDFNAV